MKVLDFSTKQKRHWGHDFSLCNKLDDDGYKWVVSVHHTPSPEVGDMILMALNYNDVRIGIIEKVISCANPSDMYFLDINIKDAKKKYEDLIK